MKYSQLKANSPSTAVRSKSAMSFGGVWLDEVIEGYKTLNVEGRETISYNLTTAGNLDGRDGTVVYAKSLTPRTLTVTYEMKGNTPEEYQRNYAKLNEILHTTKDAEIRFNDDPFIYYGQVSAKSLPEAGRLVQVQTFDIICQNPYRYGDPSTVSSSGVIELGEAFGTHPANPEIKVELVAPSTKIVIRNQTTGRRIIFDGKFKAGDILAVSIYPNPRVTLNGLNAMTNLSFGTTDFGDFKVQHGDKVNAEPSGSILTLSMKGAWI